MTQRSAMYESMLNLSRSHREHELFYSRSPLEASIRLQAISRALKALALHWQEAPAVESVAGEKASAQRPAVRYTGCDDLNDPRATETLGILYMEGEGEPAELVKLKFELASLATEQDEAADWLDEAMQGSWAACEALIQIPPLADLLGDRHRIIVNNWQMASHMRLMARLLRRAAQLLAAVDLKTGGVRADLAGPRTSPRYVLSAAELLDMAADLSAQAGLLVHDSEPRWRRFHDRLAMIAPAKD